MPSPKTLALPLMSLLVLAGCASQPPVQPVAVTCPRVQPPPAWMLQPPSKSLQLWDKTFSTSGPGSSLIKLP